MYKEIYYIEWYNVASEEIFTRRDKMWQDHITNRVQTGSKIYLNNLVNIENHCSKRFRDFLRLL